MSFGDTLDISPVYGSSEYEGFEIFIYQPAGEEIVIFGDFPKDTLYFERVDLAYLTDNRPKFIELE